MVILTRRIGERDARVYRVSGVLGLNNSVQHLLFYHIYSRNYRWERRSIELPRQDQGEILQRMKLLQAFLQTSESSICDVEGSIHLVHKNGLK